MTNTIGTIAAVLTTLAMFPQAIRIIKTRDVESISLLMYILNSLGILFWLAYGLMMDAYPIIFANIVAIMPALTILLLKIRLGARTK
jgi:MtN3 and saliva related transmembrane protein